MRTLKRNRRLHTATNSEPDEFYVTLEGGYCVRKLRDLNEKVEGQGGKEVDDEPVELMRTMRLWFHVESSRQYSGALP